MDECVKFNALYIVISISIWKSSPPFYKRKISFVFKNSFAINLCVEIFGTVSKVTMQCILQRLSYLS